jgi:predicted branched-subunit amino acid permease
MEANQKTKSKIQVGLFLKGFQAMLPITFGVIPFGAVMGTVAADAKLEFYQSFWMNIIVFAGAAQLAAIDLMSKDAPSLVVIATGLVINLRFLLYSAALSPIVRESSFLTKLICAYCVTDQNYAVMSSNQRLLKSDQDAVHFYLGASLCMFLVWQSSVTAGFVFGNFAPASWSLDYAVPLSFVALVIPTIKDIRYVLVAAFSSVTSLLLSSIPYKLGLIITALLGIGLATLLLRKKSKT